MDGRKPLNECFAIPDGALNYLIGHLANKLTCGYISTMTTVQEIEKALSKLPPEKLAEFRSWYTEFDAAQWDEQIERDVQVGKLDTFADQALSDHTQKRCKPL